MTDTNTYQDLAQARLQHHTVVGEVYMETNAQLDRWGVQNHPTGAHPDFEYTSDFTRAMCDKAAAKGEVTWRHILDEEFWEAFAEEDPEKFEQEMIQVAAVAVSAVASSRRARGL